jgi:hypothetical protein
MVRQFFGAGAPNSWECAMSALLQMLLSVSCVAFFGAQAWAAAGGQSSEPAAPTVPAAPEVVTPPTMETPVGSTEADKPTGKPDEGVVAPSSTAPRAAAGPTPSKFPIGFTAMFYQYVGEGSFAVRRYVRNPYYAWWVSLRPSVSLPFGFKASVRQDVDMEWTHTDANTYDRQPLLSDTRFSTSYSGLGSETLGLKAIFFGGFRAPLSLESRFRKQLVTLDAGTSLDFSKWGIMASVSAFGAAFVRMPGKAQIDDGPLSFWFNTSNTARPYIDRSGQEITPQKCIARASEAAAGACPVTGTTNGSVAQLFVMGTTGYDFTTLLNIPISVSASLVAIHGLSAYVGPNDEFTAANAKTGPRINTLTWGQLTLSWQMLDWLGLDVGANSMQPLLNGTNQYVRFPFWNIPYWDLKNLGNYSGAANYSSLSFGATVAL